VTAPVTAGIADLVIGLRHVGVVTTSRTETVTRLREVFGLDDADVVLVPHDDDTDADTWFAFLTVGGSTLEVIQPVTERFRRVLLDSGTGTNHLCFTVHDLDEVVRRLAAAGVRLGHVTPAGVVEAPSFRMVYCDPADTAGVLLEFIEDR
jgi:catechol 2,3-dioxygenase-like lactoylglutathione lyase family enzyme